MLWCRWNSAADCGGFDVSWRFGVVQMSGAEEKKYNAVYFEKDLDGRPKGSNVFAVEDAKEVRNEDYCLFLIE